MESKLSIGKTVVLKLVKDLVLHQKPLHVGATHTISCPKAGEGLTDPF